MPTNFPNTCRAALVACLLALVTGCTLDGDEPLIAKPIVEPPVPSGYILAGEVSSRVVSVLEPGCNITGLAEWPGNACVATLSALPDSQLIALCTLLQSERSYYASSYIGGAMAAVEIMGYTLKDSLMECWEITPDSSGGKITQYNSLTPIPCSGQRYFVEEVQTQFPTGLDAGNRIDSTGNWISGGYFFLNSVTYGERKASEPRRDYRLQYDRLENQKQYIGIRMLTRKGYRYGYARLSAGSASMIIYEVVMER